MTHAIDTLNRPTGWETWFAAVGVDYVEVPACPDEACRVCRRKHGAELAVAAAPEVAAAA